MWENYIQKVLDTIAKHFVETRLNAKASKIVVKATEKSFGAHHHIDKIPVDKSTQIGRVKYLSQLLSKQMLINAEIQKTDSNSGGPITLETLFITENTRIDYTKLGSPLGRHSLIDAFQDIEKEMTDLRKVMNLPPTTIDDLILAYNNNELSETMQTYLEDNKQERQSLVYKLSVNLAAKLGGGLIITGIALYGSTYVEPYFLKDSSPMTKITINEDFKDPNNEDTPPRTGPVQGQKLLEWHKNKD